MRKFILLILVTVGLTSCNTTGPPDPPPPPPIVEEPILKLELDDAHCTEAWIMLKTEKLTIPAELNLKQFYPDGDSISQIINLISKDTLLYFDSLYPKQTYKYQVTGNWYPKPDSLRQVASNKVSVTTMDTTSHNFTFEMYTFGGEIGGSVLYDVAIINENNIWAVGDILIKSDTSETGYIQYNAVHWNGSHWQLKRIRYYGGCSSVEYPPLNAIWAFSENNIVITNGGSIGWFNGETVNLDCRVYPLLTGAINKIWGTSINNLYAVGNLGTIVHYNGMSWRKIESHTTLNINDIWGDYNPKTKEWEILAVASDYPSSLNKEILKIVNETVFKLPTSDQMEPLYTVWFMPNKQYYVAGSGIYQKRLLTDLYWKNDPTDITGFATTCIRGNNINDVFGVGAFGDFVHFNGVRWKQYQEPYLYNGAYTKVAVKGDLVVAVGGNQVSLASEAVILIGRR